MGVHKLEYYIYEEKPDEVLREVLIKQEIENYIIENEKPPLIVVDLTYFLCGVSMNSRMEQLCGGRSHHFLQDIETFFGRLKEYCELTFFCNAYTKDEDFEDWIKRANERYAKEIGVLDMIYHGSDLESVTQYCLTNKIYIALQKLIHPTIWEIARRNGRAIKTYDLTRNVASYAKEHGALAVIGNNTDYLIFDGDWRYWSARKLNKREMKAYEYDKEALRNHFHLSLNQMPLLATILGNHIIDSKSIEKFHAMLPSNNPLVLSLANFVAKSTDEIPDCEDIEMVTTIVFEQKYDKSSVMKSLEYYRTTQAFEEPKTCGSKLFNQLFYEHDLFSYQVLNNKYIYTSLQFVDLRKEDIPSYSELVLNLRRKCVGLLVKNKPEMKFKQTFVTKFSHDEGFVKTEQEPIYPDYFVPSLNDLFLPLIDKNTPRTLIPERYDLLKFLISEKLDKSIINKIHKLYLTTALTILFMFENKCLTLDEADIFTLSTYAVALKRVPSKIDPPKWLDHRAFRLAFMFLRFSEHIRRCFIIAGLPHLSEAIHFDGYHFHNTYNAFMKESEKGKEVMMGATASYVQLYRTLNQLNPLGGEFLRKDSKKIEKK